MRAKIILTAIAAGLLDFALAGSTCNQAAGKQISGLAVTSPDTSTGPTLGKSFEIKWNPTSSYKTVSILLLKGPSSNVVPFSCIANAVPNSGSYSWSVPSSGIDAQSTGYGIQIIADGSGDFQYSTQFGISGSSGSGGSVVAITSTTQVSGEKVTETIYHTAALSTSSKRITASPSPSSSSSSSSSSKIVYSSSSINRTTKAYPTAYSSKVIIASVSTGVANVTESVQPTVTMSVPASLVNVGGSGHEITSSAQIVAPVSSSAPASTSVLKAAAAPRAIGATGAMGVVAAVAGALVL